MLYFFRPSRKAYILQYSELILLFIFSILILFKRLGNSSVNSYIATALIIFCIGWYCRIEYRILSRRYGLTNKRAIYSRGIFSEEFKSAQYKFITDIGYDQTFWDKLMNTGTINIDTAGQDNYEIRYRKIDDPLKIQKTINNQQK